LVELVIDTVVCLTLAKWETVSGQFGGYLNEIAHNSSPGATNAEKEQNYIRAYQQLKAQGRVS
jgi:hypothetical protein